MINHTMCFPLHLPYCYIFIICTRFSTWVIPGRGKMCGFVTAPNLVYFLFVINGSVDGLEPK